MSSGTFSGGGDGSAGGELELWISCLGVINVRFWGVLRPNRSTHFSGGLGADEGRDTFPIWRSTWRVDVTSPISEVIFVEMCAELTEFLMDSPPLEVTKTCVWKHIEEIRTDIHADMQADPVRIMAFIHGGTWMCGNRTDYSSKLFSAFLERGFAFVSFDYRLLPEATHKCQVQDVHDMEDFLRIQLRKDFSDLSFMQAIIVVGAPSGAQLALLTVCMSSLLLADFVFIVDRHTYGKPNLGRSCHYMDQQI